MLKLALSNATIFNSASIVAFCSSGVKISSKMVNVMKGVLVQCDQAMKQFLLHLDETLKLGKRFIIQDLDETHLFIAAEVIETLQAKIDDLMDQISFPVTEKGY